MKDVITSERIPIKLWLDDMEQGALDQAKNLANLPFAFHHISIMPDSHQGYGMPIGGVLATSGVVVPNAVGVDIGCGMCAKMLPLNIDDLPNGKLQKVVNLIKKGVPVGMNWHDVSQDMLLMPEWPTNWGNEYVIMGQLERATYQLGTLGGGNHFIEIQVDTRGNVWIMIHSGSRNLGKQVADYYHKLAQKLNEKYHSEIPSSWNLSFLPLDTLEGKRYMEEMNYCIDFARANRRVMMNECIGAFTDIFKFKESDLLSNLIDVPHNYATWENHFNKNVVIHRKGATSAKMGEIGIIPGSMGTKSYVVVGRGNKDSFMSCSHGAGRAMGRKSARANLSLSDELSRLDGIIHDIKDESGLDEAPSAYKDIDVVMNNQGDLVGILETLTPLAVVKG